MNPLDNVIWHALTTRQSGFAEAAGAARLFMAEVAPFAAIETTTLEANGNDALDHLSSLVANDQVIALFLDQPLPERKGWSIIGGGALVQMVQKNGVTLPSSTNNVTIETLGATDAAEMVALAALAKPGPFSMRTHELGNYFGIRDNGKLVAMSGERMKVPNYTEVSAVCTHPDHTGKGYAAALMTRVIEGIRSRDETPFLHSREDNDRAIALYERLGFEKRWSGHYAVLKRG